MTAIKLLTPQWPAPVNVRSLQTTRIGGVSDSPFDGFNLACHVGDAQASVIQNRQLLRQYVPSEPVWTEQVHGVHIIDADHHQGCEVGDGSFSRQANVVCVTMTADCLPVLLCDQAGTVVAAVHAGWRGLCDGVIEAAVTQMGVPSHTLMAWLGPAIGPQAFIVGEEVRAQFIAADAQASQAFMSPRHQAGSEKWLGNLYMIARQRLHHLGVQAIFGGGMNEDFCTLTDEARFFSFRRDQVTGRMASLIWLTESSSKR